MNELCPFCQNELSAEEADFRCVHCDRTFSLQPVCPDCAKPLQVLKGCGSVDYFCAGGDGLISKKRVKFTLRADSL